MCSVCGCGEGEVSLETGEHEHVDADGRVFRHRHDHDHGHPHAAVHLALPHDLPASRLVKVEQDLLAKNGLYAAANRKTLAAAHTLAVNLMSSPGSGKTTLLVRLLEELKGRVPLAVVEGDQQTSLDADRIRATGVPAVQINTGKGCHLDASMLADALAAQPPRPGGILFIENVGNLVCPAGFDLGEARRLVVISVTEGEDKPLKYPDMFAFADLVVVNKIDLLPHLRFDVARLVDNVRRVRPGVPVIEVSATSGDGIDALTAWLLGARAAVGAAA